MPESTWIKATISVGLVPAAIALDEFTGKVYVANFGSGIVSVIDAASLAVIAEIEVGTSPSAIAIHPGHRRAYVVNQGSNTVSVINSETDRLETTIEVGIHPRAVVVDPRADKVYVVNHGSASLSAIDGHSYQVSDIPVGERPTALVLDDRGNVYVANEASNTISILETTTGRVTEVIVGDHPVSLSYNPINRCVYVTYADGNVVSFIRTEPGLMVDTLPISAKSVLAVDSVSGETYLRGRGQMLYVMDGRNVPVASIELPFAPSQAAPDARHRKVYVSHWSQNAVSVVDIITRKTETLTVGADPSAIVVDNRNEQIFIINTAYPAEGERAQPSTVSVIDASRVVLPILTDGQASWATADASRSSTQESSAQTTTGKWTAYSPPVTIADNYMRAIAQASDGALWFGTLGGGVSRFDGSTWTTYTTADGLASNYVNAIAAASDGALWFGTSQGVSRFDGSTWTTYTTADGLASNNVYAIAAASDGALWFGTNGGVSRFDGSTWTTYTTADGLAGYLVYAITEASDGALWFGTGGGVSRFDGSTWTTYTTADGLAHNCVYAIAAASDGTLWFGTFGGGVSRFDGSTWTTYTTADGLVGYSSVFAITEASDGALWFGTGDGMSRFDDSTWTTYTRLRLRAVIVAVDGTVWAGGGGGGVGHFDGSTWTIYTTADGLASNQLQTIAQASDGALWFGTSQGVSRFDGSSWTTYTTADGLAGYLVYAITEASDGALWFGTSGGVNRFDGSTWTTYTAADGLVEDRVESIAQALDGALWFGTFGGVSRFDGSTWTTYTTADGLAANYVDDIAVTSDGRIWAFHGNGFSIFDGTQWFTLTEENSPVSGGSGLAEDQGGGIWYVFGRLKGYDGTREYWFNPPSGLWAYDLAIDSLGRKWVAGYERLFLFEGVLPALKQGAHVISVRDYVGIPSWNASTSLRLAQNAGLKFVQIPVRWADLEPVPGQYEWDILRDIQEQTSETVTIVGGAYHCYDLYPVLRIFAPPAWARPAGSSETSPPTDPQDLGDLMHALVSEFGSQFAYVIWNEPNLPGEWGGQTPNAADYVELLRAAYEGAKSAHPWARIISAGLAPTEGGGGAVRDIDFLTQMYDAGLASYCNAVGMNGLGFAYSPDDTSDPNGYNFSRLTNLRQVMVDKGDGDKKAWLLEVGWMRDSNVDLGDYNWIKVSPQQQAAYLARAVDKVRTEWPWVEAMFLWNLDYDRFVPETDQKHWFSFGQGPGYLVVAQMWTPNFHNLCGVTNQPRPVLRGSAPPYSTVSIYVDGGSTPVMTTTATYSGTFSTALASDLSPGTHVLTATATSSLSGETSDSSSSLSLTADSSLLFDPVGVSFSYHYPGSSWSGVRVPKNSSGCVDPDNWSLSLVPGAVMTVSVPVSCTGSATVNFSYGSTVVALSDSGSGLYQGTFTPAGNETSFSIKVICGDDTTSESGTLLIDPDGIVYDANQGIDTPLSGVTVACEQYKSDLDVWTLWDAWNYPYQGVAQENPQETGVDGYYSFMVPPGQYVVKAIKEGYFPFSSDVITVTDTPVHLNIPLKQHTVYLPLVLKN